MRIVASIVCFVCLTSPGAMAKLSKADWTLSNGRIVYHVHYPLKNVEGVATNVKGKGHCENGHCQFLVAVPLKDFKSGDGNRDNHMLEVTKAATNPMVVVNVNFPEPVEKTAFDARAVISFAGKAHTYENVRIDQTAQGPSIVTKGKIEMLLSHFGVERPSLLTVKIDDQVPLEIDLTWN